MRPLACLMLKLTLLSAAPQPLPTPSTTPPPPQPPHRQQAPSTLFTNCIDVDISEIEELRRMLPYHNHADSSLQRNQISFGLLEDDWVRLKLLEHRLPIKSRLKRKLVSLFRLLISAIYEAQIKSWKLDHTNPPRKFYENNLYGTEMHTPYVDYSNPSKNNETHPPIHPSTIKTNVEDTDNIVAESEQREEVLPIDDTAATSTEITSTASWKNSEDSSKLPDRKFKGTNDLFLGNYSVENENVINKPMTKHTEEYRSTTKENYMVSEDYQELKINYEKEHKSFSAETMDDKKIKEKETEEIKFVEEYDDTEANLSGKNTGSVIVVTLGYSENDGKTTNGLHYEETTVETTYGTESSNSVDNRDNFEYENSPSDRGAESNPVTTDYQVEKTTEDTSALKEDKDDLYNNEETTRPTTVQSVMISPTLTTSETNEILDENDHKSLKNESEGIPGVTEDIHGYELSTVNDLDVTKPSEKDIMEDNVSTQTSYDKISESGQSTDPEITTETVTETDSFDRSSHATISTETADGFKTSNSNALDLDHSDTKNRTNTESTIGFDPTNTNSVNNSRKDTKLHSPTISSSQGGMPSSRVINETSNTFTFVFPVYPKQTTPKMNFRKLEIYPQNQRQRIFFPEGRPRGPGPQHGCPDNNDCVRVKNIVFSNPRSYYSYYDMLNKTDAQPYNRAELGLKRWDPETRLWLNKIRTLRKKSVER